MVVVVVVVVCGVRRKTTLKTVSNDSEKVLIGEIKLSLVIPLEKL